MTHSSANAAILADDLEKQFGETRALRGLSLTVQQGTIHAVLGPNGAGKTTAVRILTTLTKPTAGQAIVAGHDVVRQPEAVRRRIGLTGQNASIDEMLTGRENLEMFGWLHHLSRAEARRRADELLAEFDLLDAATRVAKTYSGGMRRRLDLAASLVAHPSVLFLDEPTTGLDPRSRLAMWGTISGLVANGTTVLLTTQYLEEADQLASMISVVDKGTVIAEGSAAELKAMVGGERIEATVAPGSDLFAAARVLTRFGDGSSQIDEENRLVSAPVRGEPGLVTAIVRALDESGVVLNDIAVRRPTLDDVFLDLTGHVALDADGPADAEAPADERKAA